MFNNSWFKLAVVSLTGIVASFVILWGINQFSTGNGYNNMYGNSAMQGMAQGQMQMNGNTGAYYSGDQREYNAYNQMNGMANQGMNYGMNMQNGMSGYMQGNAGMAGMTGMTGMTGNMQSGMNMTGSMQGGMNTGSQQSGMDMMEMQNGMDKMDMMGMMGGM